MEIHIDVIGQKLKIATNLKNFVSGSQKFVKFIFNLGSDWDGLTVFAQFQQGESSYNDFLDENNSVYLPSEIVEGVCTLTVYGAGNDVKATTNYLTLTIDKNIVVTDAQSTNISASLYEKLITKVNSIAAQISQLGSLEEGSTTGDAELMNIRIGYDGTTYNSAGEAVREQVGNLNDSLNEKFLIGKNKFNPYYTELAGYVINDATGTISRNGDGMVSDKIKTNGAAKAIISYVTSGGVQQSKAFNVYQYRFDNTYIIHNEAASVEIKEECDYIRIYTSNVYVPTDVRKRIMVEFVERSVTGFSEYEEYYEYLNPDISTKEGLAVELAQLKDTTARLDEKYIVGENKLDPETALIGYYINDNTGKILANTFDTMVSNKIKTEGHGKAIVSYVKSDGTQTLEFVTNGDSPSLKTYQYRADDSLISVAESSSVITLDASCDYIRIYTASNYAAARKRIMVELADEPATTFTDFKEFRLSTQRNLLGGMIPVTSIMSKVILAPKRLKIKLIGDSITQGVESSDYSPTGDVILSDNPSAWSRNVGTKSWASMFKSYVEHTYNAEVINNGIRGCSTHQILYYWNELIDGTEDIVIVMLGTNHRSMSHVLTSNPPFYYTKQSLYDELQKIKDKLESNNSEVIFMSAPPASNDNETRKDDSGNPVMHFHMNDVDDVICKLASENNREYISLYKKTIDYMEKTATSIDDLLADGLHPNDRLYKLMFGWVVDGLGLSRKIDGAAW